MNFCTHKWGLRLKKRLSRIEGWAEKQGLELAADCHLARVVQVNIVFQSWLKLYLFKIDIIVGCTPSTGSQEYG